MPRKPGAEAARSASRPRLVATPKPTERQDAARGATQSADRKVAELTVRELLEIVGIAAPAPAASAALDARVATLTLRQLLQVVASAREREDL